MAKKSKTAAKKTAKKRAKKAPAAKKSAKPSAAKAKSSVTFSEATVLKRNSDVLARRNTDGTIAVLRLDSDDSFYTIDGIAAEFWSLIDDKASIEEIKDKLAKRYRPPAERFSRDVKSLVNELLREKLIRT